jgi:cytochrome c553
MRDRCALLSCVAVAGLALALQAAPARAQQESTPAQAAHYAERFQAVCAACHGANGRSEMAGVPVLAGQSSLYAITQLFLFREGRRKNPGMVALGQQMNDDDLQGFANHIGTLPAVAPPAPAQPPDAARMKRAEVLSNEHKCSFCHRSALEGGAQVPRIGGQKEEYLRQTLHAFKTGARPGYTRAMTEALSLVPEEDLDLLAYYAAHLPVKQTP